jgi:hypothetical protein
VELETEHAHLKLSDGVLHCTMKSHFSTAYEARTVIDPILKAWEVFADLQSNRGAVRFKYDTAKIIDRSPNVSGAIRAHVIEVQSLQGEAILGQVTVYVGMNYYPAPPGSFRLTPDAESLWLRFQKYVEGQEPLLSMAYFCLTVVQAIAGNRSAASKKYCIDLKVLNKLGELTAQRGDALSARKALGKKYEPLKGSEKTWIETAVKYLILRLGTEAKREGLAWIKFVDLPSI